MRYGVFGGTFDPIHYGHLLAAEEARSQLGLERVFFVPAHVSPLKLGHDMSPETDRLAMVELAIASNAAFGISCVDLDRPGPSFTVDTVTALQKDLGPEAEVYFIMGADALVDLLSWREPQKLLQLCRIASVDRPGFEVDLVRLQQALPGVTARVVRVQMPLIEVSSTDIRVRVREGRPIKYQLPESVEAYIRERGLYGAGSAPKSCR